MINSYEWKPEYSVGDETLDTQHKQLLKICKHVSDFRCDGSKNSVLDYHSILNDLAFYATRHFEAEEALLRRVGYPALEKQQTEHAEYNETLVNFLYDAINGKVDRDTLEGFLGRWWVNHILLSDMHYSDYVKQLDS
ncbi:MAG: bacteriohemerythrin [Dechloromonas sp.]|nr:bacteriohemerythrin [Dechloromonas sp.]